MIECPSVLWHLDALLPLTDFVSIGTNDLFQYMFAADRTNPLVSDRYDPLSPPALRALQTIQKACADTGTPVSICGELAGRPLEAFALIALGFTRPSAPARSCQRGPGSCSQPRSTSMPPPEPMD